MFSYFYSSFWHTHHIHTHMHTHFFIICSNVRFVRSIESILITFYEKLEISWFFKSAFESKIVKLLYLFSKIGVFNTFMLRLFFFIVLSFCSQHLCFVVVVIDIKLLPKIINNCLFCSIDHLHRTSKFIYRITSYTENQ